MKDHGLHDWIEKQREALLSGDNLEELNQAEEWNCSDDPFRSSREVNQACEAWLAERGEPCKTNNWKGKGNPYGRQYKSTDLFMPQSET